MCTFDGQKIELIDMTSEHVDLNYYPNFDHDGKFVEKFSTIQ